MLLDGFSFFTNYNCFQISAKSAGTRINIEDNPAHNGEQISLVSVSPNDPDVTVYKLPDDELPEDDKSSKIKVNDDKL
ncbi:15281_t:CDS:2, partial [Funneliformis mosseae]